MSDSVDDQYIAHLEDRVYEKVQFVANRMRQLAEDVENEAKRAKAHGQVQRLPSAVAHTVAWGVANAHVDMVASAYADLVEVRSSLK
ncbi:hypothetical protein BH772_gp044 [Gordonia phage Bachita]|uniref:Uncharacterized protein n=1 Tax=Gordonia phage Bachita TaxID=1838061 RepID=A0A160DFW9_9CAUD|nr:hypothetical protein BH772_gp044 [Gordonia phage Bachita]ANA86841.1 hypothetical protein PBI_BACHITA_167 [Gordonia phage Bachita]